MSTIKVNSIVPPNAGEGVSIDGLQMPTAGAFSNRNLIINGAMTVSQRATSGISQNGNNNYVIDRFKGNIAGQATITHSQETTGAPDGFQNWLKVVVTTADAALASNEYGTMVNYIEGYDFAQTRYGNSDAQKVTVSFKFKTNKAGVYCMIHRNAAANRNFLYEFTPVADGNWQTITYTVPGDTTGTWDKTNGTGWRWELCIGNGTAFHSSTVGSWFSGTYYHSTPNQVNFLDSTSNELGITGVQLEVGSKATPFEHESYGQTLLKCQRYYYRTADDGSTTNLMTICNEGTTSASGGMPHPVFMRAVPTIAFGSGIRYYSPSTNTITPTNAANRCSTSQLVAYITATGLNAGGAGTLYRESVNGYIELNAEL